MARRIALLVFLSLCVLAASAQSAGDTVSADGGPAPGTVKPPTPPIWTQPHGTPGYPGGGDSTPGHPGNGGWDGGKNHVKKEIIVCPAIPPCPACPSCPSPCCSSGAVSNECNCHNSNQEAETLTNAQQQAAIAAAAALANAESFGSNNVVKKCHQKRCKPFKFPAPPKFICEKLSFDRWAGADANAAASTTAAPADGSAAASPTSNTASTTGIITYNKLNTGCLCFALKCVDECRHEKKSWDDYNSVPMSASSADAADAPAADAEPTVDAQGRYVEPVRLDKCGKCVFKVWIKLVYDHKPCHDTSFLTLLNAVRAIAQIPVFPPKCHHKKKWWNQDGSWDAQEYDTEDAADAEDD